MRHDAVLWIQWQAEILAVVFLFHWRTLNLLSEAIRLETFIECSLDFGCIGIEVFVDDVVHITCNGNLSLAYKPLLYSGYMKTWNAEGAFRGFTFSYLKNLLSCLMAWSNCLAGRW